MVESKCQRSKTTGSLLVIMPKVNPKETTYLHAAAAAPAASKAQQQRAARQMAAPAPKKLTLQEQMMQLALAEQQAQEQAATGGGTEASSKPSAAVDIASIVKKPMARSEAEEPKTIFDLPAAAPRGQSLVTEID